MKSIKLSATLIAIATLNACSTVKWDYENTQHTTTKTAVLASTSPQELELCIMLGMREYDSTDRCSLFAPDTDIKYAEIDATYSVTTDGFRKLYFRTSNLETNIPLLNGVYCSLFRDIVNIREQLKLGNLRGALTLITVEDCRVVNYDPTDPIVDTFIEFSGRWKYVAYEQVYVKGVKVWRIALPSSVQNPILD